MLFLKVDLVFQPSSLVHWLQTATQAAITYYSEISTMVKFIAGSELHRVKGYACNMPVGMSVHSREEMHNTMGVKIVCLIYSVATDLSHHVTASKWFYM